MNTVIREHIRVLYFIRNSRVRGWREIVRALLHSDIALLRGLA